MLMTTAVLQIVALDVYNENTIPMKNMTGILCLLTAQNANAAQTNMDMSYFIDETSHESECALHALHHRHIYACPTNLNICMSFPSEDPNRTFKTYA